MVFLLDPIFSTPEVSESQTFTRWVPLLLCPSLFFPRKCPSFVTVQPSPHFLLLHDLALHSPNSREDIEGGNDVNEMVLCGTF